MYSFDAIQTRRQNNIEFKTLLQGKSIFLKDLTDRTSPFVNARNWVRIVPVNCSVIILLSEASWFRVLTFVIQAVTKAPVTLGGDKFYIDSLSNSCFKITSSNQAVVNTRYFKMKHQCRQLNRIHFSNGLWLAL